jgi:hypothetical protein
MSLYYVTLNSYTAYGAGGMTLRGTNTGRSVGFRIVAENVAGSCSKKIKCSILNSSSCWRRRLRFYPMLRFQAPYGRSPNVLTPGGLGRRAKLCRLWQQPRAPLRHAETVPAVNDTRHRCPAVGRLHQTWSATGHDREFRLRNYCSRFACECIVEMCRREAPPTRRR